MVTIVNSDGDGFNIIIINDGRLVVVVVVVVYLRSNWRDKRDGSRSAVFGTFDGSSEK